jgi:hypothetical protein
VCETLECGDLSPLSRTTKTIEGLYFGEIAAIDFWPQLLPKSGGKSPHSKGRSPILGWMVFQTMKELVRGRTTTA